MGQRRSRISTAKVVPGAAISGKAKPIPMPASSEGLSTPLVTRPTGLDAARVPHSGYHGRGGGAAPRIRNATLRRVTPVAFWRNRTSQPVNSPLFQLLQNLIPASSDGMDSFDSCAKNGYPIAVRNVSRAPDPARQWPGLGASCHLAMCRVRERRRQRVAGGIRARLAVPPTVRSGRRTPTWCRCVYEAAATIPAGAPRRQSGYPLPEAAGRWG